jgi:pilus assembly protein CpaB
VKGKVSLQRYKPYVFLALAVVMALVTSIGIYSWLKSQTAPEGVSMVESEVRMISVAAADLSWGTTLTPEMIEQIPFPADKVPQGYVSDATILKDRVIVADMKHNEPFLESKLAALSAVGGIASVTSPDKRAMAVKVDEVVGVAGFIKPNDRVDVMVTMETTPGNRMFHSKIILQNIRVLASGTEMVRGGKEGEAKPVSVIALEVTVDEAEKLSLASTQGSLRLALRNPVNTESVLTKGATPQSVFSSYRPAEPQEPREEPVEVIRGGQRSIQKSKS